jgi:O-succinylbenzoate synthase
LLRRLYRYKLGAREGLILQVGDGFGEIAPLPKFSKETLTEALAEITDWIHSGKVPTLPSVRWGIECAQKPLRPVHIPLCSLGPKPGYPVAKLKLGHLSIDEAIVFVKNHLPHFQLRLDCNKAWTIDQALEFAKHFKPTDFLYLEEPVRTFKELAQFSQITQFPIALDESIHSNWSAIPTLKAIIVKPTVVGAIPQVPPHLNLVLSSAYESGLGLLHIANRAPNSLPIGLDTVFQDDLLNEPIRCENGYFSWNGSNPPINFSKLCAL